MLWYFFFPLALILSSFLGLFFSTSWAFAPFVWVLIIMPIIDLILTNLKKEKQFNYTVMIMISLVLPIWFKIKNQK